MLLSRKHGDDCAQLLDWLPIGGRVVFHDGSGDSACVGAQVLLVDDAVTVDDERHDAGVAVFHRGGDDCETARHSAVHDVRFRAAFGLSSLSCEDAERVAVDDWRFVRSGERVLGEYFHAAQRAGRLAVCDGPIEAVLFSCGAEDLRGVEARGISVVRLLRVDFFRIGDCGDGVDGEKFISPDLARQDFVLAGLGIEVPVRRTCPARAGPGRRSCRRRC